MNSPNIGIIVAPDGRTFRSSNVITSPTGASSYGVRQTSATGPANKRDIGYGVLGYNNLYDRTDRDKQMISAFSCAGSKENFTSSESGFRVHPHAVELEASKNMDMIYPRSVMDQPMLKEFSCPCKEGYTSRARENFTHSANSTPSASQCHCGPNCPCGPNCRCGPNCNCASNGVNKGPIASLNFNPYNSSSNVNYVPLN